MKKIKLDSIDRKILDFLVKNARTPFTEIAKSIDISAGTVHVRFKKMEEAGIIKGSTISLDYQKLGFNFMFYMTVAVKSTTVVRDVLKEIHNIRNVTVANIVTGEVSLICKIRVRDTHQAKDIIFRIGKIKGVEGTETLVSLEETINDKNRLMEHIFRD